MNLSITLNAEQTAALDDLLAGYNANRPEPVTTTVYLETVVVGLINDKAKQRFDDTAKALVESVRLLPYENRIAITEQVETQVASAAQS